MVESGGCRRLIEGDFGGREMRGGVLEGVGGFGRGMLIYKSGNLKKKKKLKKNKICNH
jgi:hypothetical protein